MGKAQLDSFFASHMNAFQQQTFFEDIIAGNVDAEYDLYNYSFPGGSGSFYFASSTETRLNPKADIKVAKTGSGFKVTDDLGNAYFFEAQEFTSSQNLEPVTPDFDDNSCFYLSKIIANNGSVAKFKYKEYLFRYTRTSKSIFHVTAHPDQDCPNSDIKANEDLTTIYYLLPDSLIFPEGYIKFNHSGSVRQDLHAIDSGSNVPYLQSISIYNYLGQKIKDFSFYQSYFGTNGRLRLDSLLEAKDSLKGREWKFSYYGQTNTLGIFGNAKDHWGYLNANSANTTIPRADYASFISNWQNYSVDYADRTSNFDYSVQGLIKNITYPTGGSTQFEYEPNQFKLGSYADYAFNPFMEIPTTSYTNFLAGGTEYYGGTDTGSFNIPVSGYYMLSSYKQLSPDPFYDNADITFTGPSWIDLYNAANDCGSTDCTTWQKIIFILAGHYTYAVKGSYYANGYGTFYLAANFSLYGQASGPVYYPIGGCRIAKITHTDSIANNKLIRRYIYYDTLPNISFKQLPNYVTTLEQRYLIPPTFCSTCGSSYTVHDESVIPLVGNVIEYGIVTELKDSSGVLGKTENHYLLSENIAGATSSPATAPVNTNWRVGDILEQDIYSNSGTLVAKNQNTDSANFMGTQINGLKVSYSAYCVASTGREYSTNLETIFSESFRRAQGITILYYGSNQITQTDSLYYNLAKHNRTTGARKDNSDNTRSLKKAISVFDYDSLNVASSAAANALKALKQNNINEPIEEVEIKEVGGVQYVIGGILRIYKENQNAIDKIYVLKISSPKTVSNFVFSHVNSSGTFIYDSSYGLKAQIELYDSHLNVLQQRLANNYKSSYIWDYNSLYPVAEVNKADSASIAYTSFEANGKGGWTYSDSVLTDPSALTGTKCYNVSGGNITRSGLTNATYVVSYWGKNGSVNVNSSGPTHTGRTFGSWTYYEHEVTSTSITVSGSNYIDELRLYPKGALMTTYTYTPLIGLTSQCDPNNRIAYYEYDKFGRLSIIKDQDNKVVKKICYNYVGQVENCSSGYYSNVVKSGSFTRNNCDSFYTSTPVTYIVPVGTYSSPISQNYVDSLAQNDVNSNGQTYANTHGTCTFVCNDTSCTPRIDHTCVNGVCETGIKIYTSSTLSHGQWSCVYHYEFSDCSKSSNAFESSGSPCSIGGGCP